MLRLLSHHFHNKRDWKGYGTLVGLTIVTGTSVNKSFASVLNMWNTSFLALVGLTDVKDKKDVEEGGCIVTRLTPFRFPFSSKIRKQISGSPQERQKSQKGM